MPLKQDITDSVKQIVGALEVAELSEPNRNLPDAEWEEKMHAYDEAVFDVVFPYAMSLVSKALEQSAKDVCLMCRRDIPIVDLNDNGWLSHREEGKGYPRKCNAMLIQKRLRELREGLTK